MNTATLVLQIADGSRQPFGGATSVRLIDGAQRTVHQAVHHASTIRFTIPFTDGPNDLYRVLVSADDHLDAGQVGVRLDDDAEVAVAVMLLPRKSRLAFEPLSALSAVHPRLEPLMRSFLQRTFGSSDDGAYSQLHDVNAGGLATLLSISSAFAGFGAGQSVTVDGAGQRHPLEFVEELQHLDNDRFFALAQDDMVTWLAAAHRTFSVAPHALHRGSFISFKEVRYPEGNVQFTFSKTADAGVLTLDGDIDLFRDNESHALIELLPTDVLHLNAGTDPRQAYALRWMSVQRAKASGGLGFDPPFSVTAR